ncbi:ThiF family adenylyltransferase [Bradyrhizobium huanghuaihaiense]|uniref:ThiF family adenylyltransferase n=1 Tax=Bradyrhizobium huanghuaihaiense TaxID=990078 RepID=UPI0021AA34B3|nr:ThiF family adenylyltransferase [Bradyrhizobium sp. CB3035]UWU75983.1 ThiF family adenylyltransferase [Bradyrhizobium sp. CB3035]
MWYVTNLARFKSEREALDGLAADAEWLRPLGWRVDQSMRLVFDADICVGEREFPISLQYPAHFPYTPPSVLPRGDETRWSVHQFGPGGELCLEYRPDNWTSDIMGVQLVESAHRLLATENPASGIPQAVASAHRVSLGQSLRARYLRFLVTRELNGFLAGLTVGTKLTGHAVMLFRPEAIIYVVDKISRSEADVWTNEAVPASLSTETYERQVSILRIPNDVPVPSAANFEEFRIAVSEFGFSDDETFLVLVRDEQIHPFAVFKDSVYAVATVPPQVEAKRLDDGHQHLQSKLVGVVGCGSLGSKFATMLARSGVGRFYLVDDDVLLPDNFVRHDLDWRDVGTHKVNATAQRLRHVKPTVEVAVRRIRVAGQEASEDAESVLGRLAACDLIVDATANPNVFNLLASIAGSAQKPMTWAEVFGGGIGGLIARSRPNIEPSPQLVRRAIENWFGERVATPVRATRDYATGGEGPPLIADDADVTSIAAPAARLAIDTLLNRDPSYFSHSAYAIGLGAGSVFSQAFETYPIDLGVAPEEEKRTLNTEEAGAQLTAIVKLFKPQ